MTHPMLEAAARAACVAFGQDPDEHIYGGQAQGFQDYGPRWQAEHFSDGILGGADYVALARAVLQSLMNPTEDMLSAGFAHIRDYENSFREIRDAWQAMLTQALSENK